MEVSGAISAFGTRSPIYFPPGETGLGIIQGFGDKLEFSAGYLAGEASDPSQEAGLFDGSYSAIGQLTITPFEKLTMALTYVMEKIKAIQGWVAIWLIFSPLTAAGEDIDPFDPGVFEGGVPT